MTLKSRKLNKGGAERVKPLLGSLSTMSQWLVRRVGQPFTVCGPIEMISPNCPQCLWSCCSMISLDNTGTLIILIGMNKRSEEHTSELQSLRHLVCRLLLEKKKIKNIKI